MQCNFCGGEAENKIVTFMYEGESKYVLVENVPAEVCKKCGEKTYSPEVTDELLKYAKTASNAPRTVEVPIFRFAASA